MLNVLGDKATQIKNWRFVAVLWKPTCVSVSYGKTTRPERKMGHINVVTSSMQDAESRLSYILVMPLKFLNL